MTSSNSTRARYLPAALALLWSVMAAGQQVATTPADSPEFIILKMQSLLDVDAGIADAEARRIEHVVRLREAPALAERFDRLWPEHRYRPLAKSILIDAFSLLRKYGDAAGSNEAMLAAAESLLAVKPDKPYQAKAQFVILGLKLNRAMAGPTSQPATMATTTTSAPADRQEALAQLAGQYVQLCEDFAQTTYAPAALYSAGSIYLDLQQEPRAVAVLDKLAQAYPKDPLAFDALRILIRLHTNAGREDAALAAKRKVVVLFGDTSAAQKYRADIARADCLGQEFRLRFAALDGRRFDIRDHRGKAVWVYFFDSALEAAQADAVADDIAQLTRLLGDPALVAAVGGDRPEDGEKVIAALAARKVALPVLLDSENKVAEHYGVVLFPAVVKVDAEGKLADIICGPQLPAQVAEQLQPTTQPAYR